METTYWFVWVVIFLPAIRKIFPSVELTAAIPIDGVEEATFRLPGQTQQTLIFR